MPQDDRNQPDENIRARRTRAAPAVEGTAAHTPEDPPGTPGNSQRAWIGSRGLDPGAPPEPPPTDVVDAPGAPARPPDPDDVDTLLLGDEGWGAASPPPPRAADLTGWVDMPALPAEARAARRRRLGFTDERPRGLDPGAALLHQGAVGWVRAAAPWLVVLPDGPALAAQAITPWGPWVARGRAGRLDAARLALAQLALLRAGRADAARSIHLTAHAARLDVYEVSVRAQPVRFPTVGALLKVAPGAPLEASASRWSPVVSDWLDLRPPPVPRPVAEAVADHEALRRAFAEQGLRIAREVNRLRVRAAGVVLLAGAHATLDPAAVAGAASGIDTHTQAILTGLGALGRGLHQAPPLPSADARRALTALSADLQQVALLATGWLARVAEGLGDPPAPPLDRRGVARRLAQVGRTPPSLTPGAPIDDAIAALLGGDTPPALDGAPACRVVIALDQLEAGARLDEVLSEHGRALLAAQASGAAELLLRAV